MRKLYISMGEIQLVSNMEYLRQERHWEGWQSITELAVLWSVTRRRARQIVSDFDSEKAILVYTAKTWTDKDVAVPVYRCLEEKVV